MLGLLAAGAGDNSLSVRIPTAAALAALSEALRSPSSGQAPWIGLHDAAKSAHLPLLRIRSGNRLISGTCIPLSAA